MRNEEDARWLLQRVPLADEDMIEAFCERVAIVLGDHADSPSFELLQRARGVAIGCDYVVNVSLDIGPK